VLDDADGDDHVAGSDASSGRHDPLLVLENSAGGGDGVGSSIEDLVDILEAAARAGAAIDRLGFCLDTAHLWGAGVDVADPDAIDVTLDRFDAAVGADRLAMIHLNDARTVLGSRVDRHEHIAAGGIGRLGSRHLLTHPRLAGVPTYLETPAAAHAADRLRRPTNRPKLTRPEQPTGVHRTHQLATGPPTG
jgi:deoxyribonuclease IV